MASYSSTSGCAPCGTATQADPITIPDEFCDWTFEDTPCTDKELLLTHDKMIQALAACLCKLEQVCVLQNEQIVTYRNFTGELVDISGVAGVATEGVIIKVLWNGVLLRPDEMVNGTAHVGDYVVTTDSIIKFEEAKDDCTITVIVQPCLPLKDLKALIV